MRQLALDLYSPHAPTLDNFVTGTNAELLELLHELVAGSPAERFVYLWGVPGSGRSHLLQAVAAAFHAAGKRSNYVNAHAPTPAFETLADADCVAIDDVDALDECGQAALFNLYNALRAGSGALLACGAAAPAGLTLRADVKTRLAWGLVYQVHALSDEEKVQALAQHAQSRGLRLPREVIDYLLRHGRRDLPALIATLDALDRYSLETKRPVTVPMLKEWMRSRLLIE